MKKHLNGLTGLRFWAATLVMFYHFTSYLGPLPVISEATRFGNSGVTFFFVLSGFVLAWTYLDVRIPKRVFYWRRFARIWPLHILTTVISLAAWRLVDHPIGHAINVETLWPAFFLVHAWASDFRVIQGGSGASWSLSAEAFFYAMFPFILALLAGIRNRAVLMGIPMICTLMAITLWLGIPSDGVGPYAKATFLGTVPLTRILQFISGVALGIAVKKDMVPKLGIGVGLSVVAAYLTVMYFWSETVERGTQWYPQAPAQMFSIIPFGILIVAVAQADLANVKHAFRGRFIELLGQASFALYLIHVPAALVWQYLFDKPASVPGSIVAWIVSSVVAVGVSIALYRFFERPVERMLRGLVGPKSTETSGWRTQSVVRSSMTE